MHIAIYGNHLAGNVPCQRRGEKGDQVRHVLRVAKIADRDIGRGKALLLFGTG
jgi:hypothetical protein